MDCVYYVIVGWMCLLQDQLKKTNEAVRVFAGRVLEILKIEVPFLFLNLYLIKKLHIQV